MTIARAPAVVDAHVAANDPAQFLQPLCERGNASVPFRIVGSQIDEHAEDEAHHQRGLEAFTKDDYE